MGDQEQLNNGDVGGQPGEDAQASEELQELLQSYQPGKPFPGATMRVGRATKARTPLMSDDQKDRALGL